MMQKRKYDLGKHLGYGVGSLGDSLSYNIFYSYFIYFITTFAGIRPAAAGVISFVAVAWDAVTDPLIGYVSDHSHSKHGRRCPFLLMYSVPMGLTVFALFYNPTLSESEKVLYYLVANILFWLFFTCVDIPYLAFGAELETGYDERTRLRKWARLFMSVGDILVVSGTLPLVDLFSKFTHQESSSWALLGAFYGGISAIAFFLSGFMLRKYDAPVPRGPRSSFKKVLREYFQILKIREGQKIILVTFIANLIIGIGSSCNMFMWKYTFHFESAEIAMVGLVGTLCSLFAVFPTEWIASRFGKKNASSCSFLLILVGFMILYFAPHTLPWALAAQIIKLCGVSMFWTIVFSLAYDVAEIDEFKNGQRREGLITSLNSFFMKIGVSFGMWFSGTALDIFQLDPTQSVQSEKAVSLLNMTAMIVPAVIAVFGICVSRRYRVTKVKFTLLKEALAKRRECRAYSTQGFEDILK